MRARATLKSRLRFPKSKKWKLLKKACFLMAKHSNSLANQALYSIKKHYKDTWEFIKFWELDRLIKNDTSPDNFDLPYNRHYRWMMANSAQWTIKSIYNEYKSYFALLRKKLAWKYDAVVKEPYYKKKNGLFKLIYAKDLYMYDSSLHSIKLGIAKKIKEELWFNNNTFITFKLPSFIEYSDIQEVRIQPSYDGFIFDIEIVYYTNIPESNTCWWFMGIDLGVNNLASCITSNGEAFIYDWRELKSYNKYYNKQLSKIQSVKDKCKQDHYTNKQKRLTYNRTNFITNYFNQVIASIVKYCRTNNIGTIVVWKNDWWKQEVNIWSKNNQTFYNIPHAKLIDKIEYKASLYNIQVIKQEEAHTSKCSFLDNESIEHHDKYAGKRVKRWLFKTTAWKLVNADINGSANILKKWLQSLKVSTESMEHILTWVCRGFVSNLVILKLKDNFLSPSFSYETTT